MLASVPVFAATAVAKSVAQWHVRTWLRSTRTVATVTTSLTVTVTFFQLERAGATSGACHADVRRQLRGPPEREPFERRENVRVRAPSRGGAIPLERRPAGRVPPGRRGREQKKEVDIPELCGRRGLVLPLDFGVAFLGRDLRAIEKPRRCLIGGAGFEASAARRDGAAAPQSRRVRAAGEPPVRRRRRSPGSRRSAPSRSGNYDGPPGPRSG